MCHLLAPEERLESGIQSLDNGGLKVTRRRETVVDEQLLILVAIVHPVVRLSQ